MPIVTRQSLRSFVRSVFIGLMDVHFIGLENVPPTGGYILATNHLSRLDTPLIFMAIDRLDLAALVTDKYRNNPLFALFVEVSESIWINRDIADLKAIRAGLAHINRGGILGIAPEGTRSHNGQMLQAKSGVALLAEKAGVPIIPVGIHGTEDSMHRITHFKRPEVYATFGIPFVLPALDHNDREQSLIKNTEEIMCRIASILPAEYHGYYASNPRINELKQGME